MFFQTGSSSFAVERLAHTCVKNLTYTHPAIYTRKHLTSNKPYYALRLPMMAIQSNSDLTYGKCTHIRTCAYFMQLAVRPCW